MPKSIEAYYQETGRGGRDGLPANAWLAYGLQDVIIHRQMLNEGQASVEQKRVEQRKLDAMLGLCEASSCRRQALLNYFGDAYPATCGNCDNCLHAPEIWEGTKAAQKALSCVFRTQQIFGVMHLVDVLTGKETEKVLRSNHHQLSVFGVGKDLRAEEWRSIFRQLIAMGHLRVDIASFGALRLGPSCTPLMKGEANIFFRKMQKKTPNAKKEKGEKPKTGAPDNGLFDALKALRLQLSREHGVPPYVIFHDRTLIELAEHRPNSLEAMSTLHGVGEHKLKKYGEVFLQALKRAEQ
jgi:ATP-dependent DNA helicase RecQ